MRPTDLPGRPANRTWWVALVAILLVGAWLGWAGRPPEPALLNDEARYVLLSRSILAGHYRDLEIPDHPPHAQYPPAFPALLAAVTVLTGPTLEHGVIANLMVLALSTVLVAVAVRRLEFPLLGLAAAAALSVNPALVELGGMLLADPLYILALAGFHWVLQGAGQPRRGHLAAGIGFALLGFLSRSIGLAMLGALAMMQVSRLNRRTLVQVAGVLIGCIVIWFGYTIWAGRDTLGHTYADDVLEILPRLTSSEFLGHVAGNASYYFSRAAHNQFGVPPVEGNALPALLFGFLLLGFAGAALPTLWTRWRSVLWVCAATIAILLVFPWGVDRYFTPIVPWIIVSVLLGATVLGRRLGMSRPELAGAALAGLLVCVGAPASLERALVQTSCRSGDAATDLRCVEPPVADFVRAVRYLQDSLPQDVVVASSQPATIFLRTGLLGVPIEQLRGSTELVAPRGPVDVVMLSAVSSNHGMLGAIEAECGAYEMVGSATSSALLLRRRITREDACGTIAAYLERYRGISR